MNNNVQLMVNYLIEAENLVDEARSISVKDPELSGFREALIQLTLNFDPIISNLYALQGHDEEE